MPNRTLSWILLIVAVFAVAPVLFAQTAGTAKAAPDLSGVWERRGMGAGPAPGILADGAPGNGFTTQEPAMLPWAADYYKKVRNGPIRNPYDKALDQFDTTLRCFPPGPTRLYTVPRPFEIRQLADQVFLLFESDHSVRRIYTDGRGHPDGYPITWMGHSIGKWDGDTLVVDTVNINDKGWIDSMGHPHSDALRIVERFHRLDRETLEIEFLFDDPKTYSKPWTGKKRFKLQPANYDIMEQVLCEEWLEIGKKKQPGVWAGSEIY